MKLDIILHPKLSTVTAPYFGIEYEIEAIKRYNHWVDENFKIITDGSLRNDGKEFISLPLNYEATLDQFIQLHNNLQYLSNVNPYSERTSIHVHVNCQNLEKEQIINLIRLYIITEPIWFQFISEERQNSIYCVPIYSTILQSETNHGLYRLIKTWHKYTAFNILPLHKFGTIEFRHLEGTDSYERFYRWLSAINNLFLFIYNNRFEVVENLNIAFYISWIKTHLEPILPSNITDDYIKDLISPTLLDIKLSFI